MVVCNYWSSGWSRARLGTGPVGNDQLAWNNQLSVHLYFQLHAFDEHEAAIVGNLNFSKLDVSSAINAARFARIHSRRDRGSSNHPGGW